MHAAAVASQAAGEVVDVPLALLDCRIGRGVGHGALDAGQLDIGRCETQAGDAAVQSIQLGRVGAFGVDALAGNDED